MLLMNYAPAVVANTEKPRVSVDFQDHLRQLEARNLVTRIDHPINKDTELHPLVRLQFIGDLAESERRAFLFTNVVDGTGKRFDIPVVVGAFAASSEIYAQGMGCVVSEIGGAWLKAIRNPIAPVQVPSGE
jgi:3-polyprenyl-4-hydroxybenzoate decarboxylase